MAKRSFVEVGKRIQAAVDKASNDMKVYGDLAADLIRVRTRLGYGVPRARAPRGRLKPIADSTKASRQRNDRLSEFTRPNRSNLTETGQLTKSIQTKKHGKGFAVIGPEGSRDDGDLTNEKLGEYVTDQGRPFNNLSDLEIKKIAQAIDRDIQREFKRI